MGLKRRRVGQVRTRRLGTGRRPGRIRAAVSMERMSAVWQAARPFSSLVIAIFGAFIRARSAALLTIVTVLHSE